MNDVPTGNSSETVQQYYNHLYHHYLDTLTQTYYIHWDTLGWVLLWLVVLAGSFYAFTRWQRNTRQPSEPYPVESYNGYIQESNGPVGTFLTVFFIGMVVWLLITTVLDLVNGQIY
ncbi:MAG: hypothetical protein KDE54_07965 [Caldilineaceae bacterium]|nr:hypothetical protein [Caldilineaceae bacterium]MCB0095880.1 hypothetical protein [Caldilineaceae bacterium]MCB0139042.1 hypothetical protein [Caldilineaceae bacterium]MCB9155886.1 hypothetical protein [Caldilineaceae bacterium]